MVMKSSVFWDIISCSPLKANRRFGEICGRHFQGRRISQARNHHETRSKLTATSETSADIEWGTWHYHLEERTSFLRWLFNDALSTETTQRWMTG
jgi:hypothetical protein